MLGSTAISELKVISCAIKNRLGSARVIYMPFRIVLAQETREPAANVVGDFLGSPDIGTGIGDTLPFCKADYAAIFIFEKCFVQTYLLLVQSDFRCKPL
jgi:hypothetical protein